MFSDQNTMLLGKFEEQRQEKEKADWQVRVIMRCTD